MLGDPRANIQVCVCGRWRERMQQGEGWPAWGSLLAANSVPVWWGKKWCKITYPGTISLFQLHSAPCCSTASPSRNWAPGGYTVKLSFFSFLAFSPWCKSSSCHSQRDGWHQDLAALLVASQRVFSSGLISAGLHGLKAHQDLELGCLLSVILKETAHVLDDCSVIKLQEWL